jgi:threonine dehydrogenase-like Zn-dependent dehydrogenase
MRALTWQGVENVSVEDLADPIIKEPTDAIVEIPSTAVCGSDLHLDRPLAPFMETGDILGHEPMGRVVAVGDDVRQIAVGDRP